MRGRVGLGHYCERSNLEMPGDAAAWREPPPCRGVNVLPGAAREHLKKSSAKEEMVLLLFATQSNKLLSTTDPTGSLADAAQNL